MSMYLSNDEIRSTGFEPAEFLELPPMHPVEPEALPRVAAPRRGRDARLDDRTRYLLTRWAEEYISGLVEDRDGGVDDVRAVVRDLHHDLSVAFSTEG